MSLLTLPPNSSSDRHRLLHNRNPLRRLNHTNHHLHAILNPPLYIHNTNHHRSNAVIWAS
jgi:hypothetical protein